MLPLVNEALVVKFYYLNKKSTIKFYEGFRIENKMKKKRSGPVTPAGLISLMRRFEETGSLKDRPRNGVPHCHRFVP